jgi:uncharacterized NAD(P)/FAD-binding protein YdhS
VNSVPRTIAIVGAGFSGTAVAINLLRLAHRDTALRVVLIDRAQVARGAAYAEREYPYLLNVPAGRMSASSSAPGEFLAFAERSDPQVTAEAFLPRQLYGQYLEWTLRTAALGSAPGVRLELVHGRVSRIECAPPGSYHRVHLSDGGAFAADEVVLALGNPSPARLPVAEALVGSPQYVENPWTTRIAFHPGETVLVVGTGLTMADVVVAGVEAARGEVLVHAISRHGLVPTSQTVFRHARTGGGGDLCRAAARSMRQLFRAARELTETAERSGDWREAVTLLRKLAPALWARMPMIERQRFLRHIRPLWDVHRHRLPQVTAAALAELSRARKLHVRAGHIVAFGRQDGRIRVSWRPRGERNIQTSMVDRVVNCTGPDYDPRRSPDPLLRSLLAEGVAVADPLGLGLRTGPFGALVDARCRAASNLFYVGPLLRADYWEATAVQELRLHAERLARHLLARMRARTSTPAGWDCGPSARYTSTIRSESLPRSCCNVRSSPWPDSPRRTRPDFAR